MDLLTICLSAFIAVFLLLALLAAVMRLILIVFPQHQSATDSAVVAAIHSSVHNFYPGKKITKIEEIQR